MDWKNAEEAATQIQRLKEQSPDAFAKVKALVESMEACNRREAAIAESEKTK